MIDQMEAILVGLGVPNAVSQVATVRQQLRLAESAGYLCAGVPSTSAAYVLKDDTSECLHASNAEIPATTPKPCFEVIHLPLADNNDDSDLWRFNDLGTGKSVTSQANGRFLHASNTLATGQGHKSLYTARQTTSTMPKNSRLFPLIHRTSLPLVAISSLPASGRICVQLMARYHARIGRTKGLSGPGCQRVQALPLLISENSTSRFVFKIPAVNSDVCREWQRRWDRRSASYRGFVHRTSRRPGCPAVISSARSTLARRRISAIYR